MMTHLSALPGDRGWGSSLVPGGGTILPTGGMKFLLVGGRVFQPAGGSGLLLLQICIYECQMKDIATVCNVRGHY